MPGNTSERKNARPGLFGGSTAAGIGAAGGSGGRPVSEPAVGVLMLISLLCVVSMPVLRARRSRSSQMLGGAERLCARVALLAPARSVAAAIEQPAIVVDAVVDAIDARLERSGEDHAQQPQVL